MKRLLKTVMAAAAFAGVSWFASTPAHAQYGYGWDGPDNAITFSYGSGGYCDSYGCPPGYWDLPVFYGQVYYRGVWYRGPIYYRDWRGQRWFWIRGNWRTDQWRGPRPYWARDFRVGPALGFGFYDRDSRFRIREEWRRDYRQRDRWNDRRDNDRQGWDRRDNDRRDWNDRDNDRQGWNREDKNRRNDSRQGWNRDDNNRRDDNRRDNDRGDRRDRDGQQQQQQMRQQQQPGTVMTPFGPQEIPQGDGNRGLRGENRGGGDRPSEYPRNRTQN